MDLDATRGCGGIRSFVYESECGVRAGHQFLCPGQIVSVYGDAEQTHKIISLPTHRATQPQVAIVFSVETTPCLVQMAHVGVQTGRARFYYWDLQAQKFSHSQLCDAAALTRLPPCCGRGAACPHLRATERPLWQNGDEMDLGSIDQIPNMWAQLLAQTWPVVPQMTQKHRERLLEVETRFRNLLSLASVPLKPALLDHVQLQRECEQEKHKQQKAERKRKREADTRQRRG